MDWIFAQKLALSFLVGGGWIVSATVLADRLGPKAGGFVSGLPSTVPLSLFFLAWVQDPGAAVQATTVIPIVAGVNSLFLAVYACLGRRGLGPALMSGLTIWSALAYALVRTRFDNYAVSLLGFGPLFAFSYWLTDRALKFASIEGRSVRYTASRIIGRALIGGSAVTCAVFLGKVGGPLWGGIFSTFPAMFLSTILVTYFAHGALFSATVMKSAMLSGVSVVVYSIVVRLVYLPLGLGMGTLVSLLVSYASGWAIYRWGIVRLR